MSDLYKPPEVRVADPVLPDEDRRPLASHGSRFLARVVDALIYVVPMLVVLFATGAFADADAASDDMLVGISILAALLWVVVIFGVNLYLLHANGQTLAKKLFKIKILRTSYAPASLGRIFALRMFIPNALFNIPFVGAILGLVNALLIFGSERKCGHDYLADTIVVEAD